MKNYIFSPKINLLKGVFFLWFPSLGELVPILREIRRGLYFLVAFILIAVDSYGQKIAKTGALDDGGQDSGTSKLTVWAVPAEQKVRPDDGIETSNLVWSAENNEIKVAGAANEHVPFQVVITTSVSGSPHQVE